MENYVSLDRQFSPVSRTEEEAETNEILSYWGYGKSKSWAEMDNEFRCVILAEAGAGKTEELRQHAKLLLENGKPAFFIRIEDIETDFYNAFEVGDEIQFQSWLQSTGEAWFFLDSVDEARLENPRDFEKAILRFAKGIETGANRAHICLSSRPYSWRPKEDRRLLDEILFLPAPIEEDSEEEQSSESQSALTIYTMLPLDRERIRFFCVERGAENIDRLLQEIERVDLWSLAERPFDLEGILAKWADDNALGGRLELLSHNIDKRLRDDHSSDRAQRQSLNIEKARDGARRLAAAVVLSGKPGLNVPDATPTKPGIEAESVLADWDPKDVRALLERGIFNDIIYGVVRFRHRDVRELLAAEWFDELLKTGNCRHSIESLFFREQYGEKIIAPRLRPVLPWLILFDEEIRRMALEIHPEIAVEEGDPSHLPLPERQKILQDIVHRIASDGDERSAQSNDAITRIANPDLSEDAYRLINEYGENDDAIFFLGRLVWQGEMTNCVEPLVNIAVDNLRGIYARRVSARAVMTCGSKKQKQNLWKQLNENNEQLSRELLAELVQEALPDSNNITQLLISLGKLPPYERYKGTGLGQALHEFIDCLSVDDDQIIITQLIDGLHDYLSRSPYIERRECHVSEEYAWLLSPATHAVERLVKARNTVAYGKSALTIMLMVPALRFWRESDFSEHKSNLQTLVPSWPELNDALYWASIEKARVAKAANSSESFIDDWSLSWLGHFWKFDTDSLPRLFDYMQSRELQDDKFVALSTAFRVYVQADKPEEILNKLKKAANNNHSLQNQLDLLLNPPVSETTRRHDEEHAEYLCEQEERKERENIARENWIEEIRANPDCISNPPNMDAGGITDDQYWLMRELHDINKSSDLECSNWQALIPDFGEDVARAYRDAAVKHWQHYFPGLRSEGSRTDNSIPWALTFAMAGLEIEAAETANFPNNLNESEVCHALRYITWQLNGFPCWFEQIYQAFPQFVEEAVVKELMWELENTNSDQEQPRHYILHDLIYHAPWLHAHVAHVILDWVTNNPNRIETNKHYCLEIMVKGGIEPVRLAELARQQISQSNDPEIISWWYALRVDCDPNIGIPEVTQWLSDLDEETATRVAQIFITALMGGHHARDNRPHIGLFRTTQHLKSLYVLMHQYIKTRDDIKRANGGVYSPESRDDAQDARNRLFSLLSEKPGKESYIAIKQLIDEHPDPSYRPWMMKHAYKRAEEDGDLEAWTAKQIYEFNKSQIMAPITNHQLFDLTVNRLQDLKNWIEDGNDSTWRTWQRVEDEPEMRNLIANWLNQKCRDQYITAQEPELANSQRMDIWMQNINVHSPVPIELKLLDKNWSGPKLCERLRNQLVGDYLRESTAGCGVMLLVWQGNIPEKCWTINHHRVGLNELASALKEYWQGISSEYSGVEAIDVIVIDLTIRARVSDS